MTTMLHAAETTKEEIEQVQALATRLGSSHVSATLMQLISAVERGVDVAVLAIDEELSPNEVAKILKVSRPYVVKLMDRDILSYRMVGTHRRVAMSDLLDYVERRERANARVSDLAANRQQTIAGIMNQAAVITPEDVAELASLS